MDAIRLERLSEFSTRLTQERLGPRELEAMRQLRHVSTSPRCNWATAADWEDFDSDRGDLIPPKSRSIVLHAAITSVARVLRRSLKPERFVISEVLIGDGGIHEVYSYLYAVEPAEEKPNPFVV